MFPRNIWVFRIENFWIKKILIFFFSSTKIPFFYSEDFYSPGNKLVKILTKQLITRFTEYKTKINLCDTERVFKIVLLLSTDTANSLLLFLFPKPWWRSNLRQKCFQRIYCRKFLRSFFLNVFRIFIFFRNFLRPIFLKMEGSSSKTVLIR